MYEIEWNLPSEGAILERIEELEGCLRNFPDSKLAPVWRDAIAKLEEQREPLTRG